MPALRFLVLNREFLRWRRFTYEYEDVLARCGSYFKRVCRRVLSLRHLIGFPQSFQSLRCRAGVGPTLLPTSARGQGRPGTHPASSTRSNSRCPWPASLQLLDAGGEPPEGVRGLVGHRAPPLPRGRDRPSWRACSSRS